VSCWTQPPSQHNTPVRDDQCRFKMRWHVSGRLSCARLLSTRPGKMAARQEGRSELDTYKVTEVGERQGVVWLSCTRRQDAQELLAELSKLFPHWRVRPHNAYTSDSGDETGWRVDKCAGRHRYALWWLIRQLDSRGWEPFAVAHEPSREAYVGPSYAFRKKIQA
jgi:hypothetical protein